MPRRALYKCPYCGAAFSTVSELSRHVRSEHGAPSICICCGAPLRSIDDVVAHATRVVASARGEPPDPCHTALLLLYGGVETLRELGVPRHYATTMLALLSGSTSLRKNVHLTIPEWMRLTLMWDKVRSVIDEWYRRPPSRREVTMMDPGPGPVPKTLALTIVDAAKLSALAARLRVPQSTIIRAAYCAATRDEGCPKTENPR